MVASSDIRAVAEALGGMREMCGGKVAVVVTAKFLHGMARMAATYADLAGFAVKAFEGIESAEGWLRRH